MSLRRALLLAPFAAVVVNGCNCGENLGGIPGDLKGTVCDPDSGIGLVNAAVHIDGPVTRDSVTDGAGGYIFTRVPEGTYTVTATLDGVVRTVDALVNPDDTNFTNTDTACRDRPPPGSGGNLVGQVCNRHTGDYVSDAQVIVELPDGPMVATTDADGNFELDGVPEGPQVVQIRGAGYQRAFAVDIVAGETFTLDLAADCNPVSATEGGIVGSFCDPEDASGNGNLVGAQVSVQKMSGGEVFTDVTDTSGQFEINGLQPDDYKVDVVKDTFHYSQINVGVVAGQLAQVTDPSNCADRPEVGRIEGEICDTDAGGRFVGTVDLIASGTTLSTTQSDDQGRFDFNQVVPGTYSVRAHRTGFERTFPGVVVEPFQTAFIQELNCPQPQDVCNEVQNQPDVASDGRILLVVDRSGSMQENDDGGTRKWDSMRFALESVTTQLQSRVQFGLMLYPGANVGVDVCDEGSQVLGLGTNNASSIGSQLDNTTPSGGTPTAVTLARARNIVQNTLNGDDPTHPRPLAVLLATDGGPNCNTSLDGQFCTCTNPDDAADGSCENVNCLDDLNTLTQVQQIRDLGVKTFVIGVLGVAAFDSVLSAMADSGGTALSGPQHYYAANNQAALESALDAITQQVLACHVEVPGVDLNAVHTVTVRVGAQALTRDPSRQNGWDITGPSSIDLFGSACDVASAPGAQNVTVQTCVAP